MHAFTWIFPAVLVGVNLHALLVLGAALTGRGEAAPQRRAWAIRCAVSGVGTFVFSAVVCGVSVVDAFSVGDVVPSERAKHLAEGISDAMNFIAFGGLALALPLLAALVLIRRRAAKTDLDRR